MRAKYQDNLEMLQWIKKYFDLNYNGTPYDAQAKRKGATLYLIGGCGQTNIGMNTTSVLNNTTNITTHANPEKANNGLKQHQTNSAALNAGKKNFLLTTSQANTTALIQDQQD